MVKIGFTNVQLFGIETIFLIRIGEYSKKENRTSVKNYVTYEIYYSCTLDISYMFLHAITLENLVKSLVMILRN